MWSLQINEKGFEIKAQIGEETDTSEHRDLDNSLRVHYILFFSRILYNLKEIASICILTSLNILKSISIHYYI